jgi:AcrR family transcriptional regulator
MIRSSELKQLDARDKQITDRLLQAAELVFADKGLEKATLREITKLAEVNLAAVSYYFGSKSDLALAVFDQLSTRLNERRLADLESNLSEAKQAGRPPDLRSILTIFIRPYVETGKSVWSCSIVWRRRTSPRRSCSVISIQWRSASFRG